MQTWSITVVWRTQAVVGGRSRKGKTQQKARDTDMKRHHLFYSIQCLFC
ncbi:hypothetical protein I8748_23975 [Nostoc sp. CENA67]|uniref:Uncharacterized protein n=1 Tax=Amazonocrinis nigriterrae CENA67 TaxID=2794033 RepID=A0A8J7L957_9NOST|nr:hypothetical protein [Amazonocrinis nigriterrae]MBH8565204.1 hypothetical protein [Amazonocrinis nigriterrae CENA67]